MNLNWKIAILIFCIFTLGSLMQLLNGKYTDPYTYSGSKIRNDFINGESTTSTFSFYYDYIRQYSVFSLGTISGTIGKYMYSYTTYPLRDFIYLFLFRGLFLLTIVAVTYGLFKEFNIEEKHPYVFIPALMLTVFPIWLINVVRVSMILGLLSILLLMKFLSSANYKFLFISLLFLSYTFFEHFTSFGAYFSLYVIILIVYFFKNSITNYDVHFPKATLFGIIIVGVIAILTIGVKYISLAPKFMSVLYSFPTKITTFLMNFSATSPQGQGYLFLNIIQFALIFLPLLFILFDKNIRTHYFFVSLIIWIAILSSMLLYFNVPARLAQYLAPFSVMLLSLLNVRLKKQLYFLFFAVAFVSSLFLFTYPQQNISITATGVACGDWIVDNVEKDTAIFSDLRVGGYLVYNDFTRVDGPYADLTKDFHEKNFTKLDTYMNSRGISILVIDDLDISQGLYPYNTPYIQEKVTREYINSIDSFTGIDKVYSNKCLIYIKK